MQTPIKSKNRPLSVKYAKLAILVGLGGSLMGCGDYGPDMKVELARRLSAGWQVDSLRIDEWEVTRRDPRQWRYRFTVKVAPVEDLYKNLGTLNNAVVLQPAARKGMAASLSGTAEARSDEAQWRSQFSFDQQLAFLEEKPASAYGPNVFIIGSAKRDAFIAAAENALRQSEAQLGADETSLSQKAGEWQVSDTTLRDSAQQAESSLQARQQQLRQEQMNIGSAVSREVQAANMNLQAELRAQMDKARKELDARNAVITQSYRSRMQAWQQQYQEMQRQRLSRDEFSERNRQLREQESGIQKQYREQLDQVRDTYSNRLKSAQQDFDARRARLQEDITRSVTANVEQSSAALQEQSLQQQGQLQESRNVLAQQRSALEQLSAQVQDRRAELVRQRALLEQIKTPTN